MKVRIGLNLGEPYTLFRLHSAPRLTDREGQHLPGLGNALSHPIYTQNNSPGG